MAAASSATLWGIFACHILVCFGFSPLASNSLTNFHTGKLHCTVLNSGPRIQRIEHGRVAAPSSILAAIGEGTVIDKAIDEIPADLSAIGIAAGWKFPTELLQQPRAMFEDLREEDIGRLRAESERKKADRKQVSPWRSAYELLVSSLLDKAVGRTNEALQLRRSNGKAVLDSYSARNTPNMRWLYAANPRALAAFDDLAEHFKPTLSSICGAEVMLCAASFVTVEGGVKDQDSMLHVDYGPPGIPAHKAFTLLTPLYQFPEAFGGLEFVETPLMCAERPLEELLAADRRRIKYEEGTAVVIHGKIPHRTEPYAWQARPRILVSLSFVTTEASIWKDGIKTVMDIQTPRFHRLPGGWRGEKRRRWKRAVATMAKRILLGRDVVAY